MSKLSAFGKIKLHTLLEEKQRCTFYDFTVLCFSQKKTCLAFSCKNPSTCSTSTVLLKSLKIKQITVTILKCYGVHFYAEVYITLCHKLRPQSIVILQGSLYVTATPSKIVSIAACFLSPSRNFWLADSGRYSCPACQTPKHHLS